MLTICVHIQARKGSDLPSDNFRKNLVEDMIASNMPG